MSKIDTSTIANFDTMTDAEKVAALTGLDLPDDKSAEFEKLQAEYQKSKASFDKTSSELAALKKEKASKQTDEERKAEEFKAMQEELNQLKTANAISANKASLIGSGFDAATAETVAKAFSEGDTEAFNKGMKSYRETLEKTLRAEILKGTPRNNGGDGSNNGTMTKEEILKITDTVKRQTAIAEHPELFGLK